MPMGRYRLRENFLAIFVAALVCVALERIWIVIFMGRWLSGIGRDHAWLSSQHLSTGLLYASALLAAMLIATTIEVFTRLTGPQTARRGVEVAVALWLGLEMSTQATEFVFERGPYSLFAINAGFWLLGMVVMGAIVGGWKKTGNSK
jgi:hypothetical protein